MMRRWRIRAAERPARRQANPPSPTRNESMLSSARSFFVRWIRRGAGVKPRPSPGGQKNRAGTQRADSISSLSLFFCASSPRGAARFFFPTERKTHRCGWLDRLGRGSIEIAVRAQKAYRFSEQAYNITRFLLCQEYFNKNLVKMN